MFIQHWSIGTVLSKSMTWTSSSLTTHTTKNLLPMQGTLRHCEQHTDYSIKDFQRVINIQAFIDNSGLMDLNETHCLTPRTCQISEKTWFINNCVNKKVMPEKTDSKFNVGTIIIKKTDRETFCDCEHYSVDGNSRQEGVRQQNLWCLLLTKHPRPNIRD